MRRYSIVSLLTMCTLLAMSPVLLADSEGEKLHGIFEEDWQWRLDHNPMLAFRFGDTSKAGMLNEISLEKITAENDHRKRMLEKVRTIDRSQLSEDDKLNFDLFVMMKERDLSRHEFRGYLKRITQRSGIHANYANVHQWLRFRNEKDYRDYISMLKQMPPNIDNTIAILRIGLSEGITPQKITVRAVSKQMHDLTVERAEDSMHYVPFKEMPDSIPEDKQNELRAEAKLIIEDKIMTAYKMLSAYWDDQYYPNLNEAIGLSEYPRGRAWYEVEVKAFTTTDMTPDEIHQLGLQEVKRIRAEMMKIIERVEFNGSFEEFLHFLRTDPQFYYDSAEELVSGYREICKRIDPELPRLFGLLPRNTYGVKVIPDFSAPSQTTGYYSGGDLKNGRAGNFFVNTYKLDSRPKYEMEALTIHEAVPGHHFQIALAQEMENVPLFRTMGGFTAFTEGWALYSESLGEELGLYKDPYSKFGQLTYEMWRAVRLVVDTGIHYKGWTRERAIGFFRANAAKTEQDIIQEIDRYIVWPGQALAYKIGELEIKKLRKYAEAELGDSFNIREFHDEILKYGSIPLSILSEKIHQYVEGAKAKDS